MANVDAPRGFKLRADLMGYQPQIRTYYIPSGDGTAVFVGDAVKTPSSASADARGYPYVAQATASGSPGDGNAAAIRGVVVGVDQVRGMTSSTINLYRTHRPASTAMYVFVVDDPNAIFEIQADDVGATLAAADIGLNADIVVGSGDATTGMSGMELDTSSKGTTAGVQLKILGLVDAPDNELGVANQNVIVKINNHELAAGTGTAGVS